MLFTWLTTYNIQNIQLHLLRYPTSFIHTIREMISVENKISLDSLKLECKIINENEEDKIPLPMINNNISSPLHTSGNNNSIIGNNFGTFRISNVKLLNAEWNKKSNLSLPISVPPFSSAQVWYSIELLFIVEYRMNIIVGSIMKYKCFMMLSIVLCIHYIKRVVIDFDYNMCFYIYRKLPFKLVLQRMILKVLKIIIVHYILLIIYLMFDI